MSSALPVERLEVDALAEAVASQPELFSGGVLPSVLQEARLVGAARRGTFSGAKLMAQDERKCLMIAALREAGESDRAIAEAVGCARESIDPVCALLEERGLIRPLKQHLERRIARVAIGAARRLENLMSKAEREGLTKEETMEVRSEGVVLGIGADKLGIGQAAPQLHLHHHEHGLDAGAEALAAYKTLLRGGSADSGSAGVPLVSNGLRGVHTVQVTSAASGGAGRVIEAEVLEGGRGGSDAAPATGGPDGKH